MPQIIQVHRFEENKVRNEQSEFLKEVDLTVSETRFKYKKMFGTDTEKKNGTWQDPCRGDSGGPLMYQDPGSGRWVIIGNCWISKNTIRDGGSTASIRGFSK